MHLWILLIGIGFLVTSCKDTPESKTSRITEVYKVDSGADDTYAKGSLKYMEQEVFRDGVLVEKIFFNDDQSTKGKDVFQFEKGSELPAGSKFYGPAGELLSTYKYTYQDTLKSHSHAYAGDTDELLRIEGYQYDTAGNMIRKTIFNEFNQKQRSFLFGHDQYGNEVKMVLTDGNDDLILSETYEIVTVDDKKRWIEKYGYVNENRSPSTFYHRIMNDK